MAMVRCCTLMFGAAIMPETSKMTCFGVECEASRGAARQVCFFEHTSSSEHKSSWTQQRRSERPRQLEIAGLDTVEASEAAAL